jgi:predicted TIM-barrel fold metal-dependent hydrolase
MIIDGHYHLGDENPSEDLKKFLMELTAPLLPPGVVLTEDMFKGRSVSEVIKLQEAAGVDMILALPGNAYPYSQTKGYTLMDNNDIISGFQDEHPDKIIGFAGVNPWEGEPAVKELERAIVELGLRGLKLFPTYHNYSPDDKSLVYPIYEKADELEIPVMIHQSFTSVPGAPMKFQHPYLLDDVARDFKDLKVIIAHFGTPWVNEAMCVVGRHKNVYADISWYLGIETSWELLRQLLRCPRYGCHYEKLFYGTDNYLTPEENLRKLSGLNDVAERMEYPKIPKKAIEGIKGDNLAKLLKIK